MLKIKQYDERQVQVRGQVFFHGFLVAVALLLLNAFLQGNEIVWAHPFDQNIIIFLVIVSVVSIESIIRGVYFGRQNHPWAIIGLFGVLTLALAISSVVGLAQGAVIINSEGLSGKGNSLLFCLVFAAITVIATVKTVFERRKETAFLSSE